MNNREFLQLATNHTGQQLGGYYISQKLDGFRAFWDGGISRGRWKDEVPWANTAKDERYVHRQVATGLWSRYGNVIHAPEWFLDKLPEGVCLDGEIYSMGLSRERLRSICARLVATDEWSQVDFWCFNTVAASAWLVPGRINNNNFKKVIDSSALDTYLRWGGSAGRAMTFEQVVSRLPEGLVFRQLPYMGWADVLDRWLEEEMARPGSEGLVATAPGNVWTPKRVIGQFKVKPRHDAEAIVIGAYAAHEGEMKGMMGALRVRAMGVEFDLGSGFDLSERWLDPEARAWAWSHPGEYGVSCPWIGRTITFRYRSLSDKGIPIEAAYWRE